MIDQPRPVEDAVLDLLRDGVYDEADELIERCGLDWAEMYIRAGKFPEIAEGEKREQLV